MTKHIVNSLNYLVFIAIFRHGLGERFKGLFIVPKT